MFKVGDVLRVSKKYRVSDYHSNLRVVIKVDRDYFTLRYITQETASFPHHGHIFELDHEATTELRFKKDLEELLHG